MPDVIDLLKKECAELYQKGVTIVRTIDGKFQPMSWQKVYQQMTELADGYCASYDWSLGIPGYATLWRDKEGKIYAGIGWSKIPSDAPFKSGQCKPIYFEELTPEKVEKLIREVVIKKDERERQVALTSAALRNA